MLIDGVLLLYIQLFGGEQASLLVSAVQGAAKPCLGIGYRLLLVAIG